MTNNCPRTGRLCIGGAYDGGDGLGIDCPAASPDTCPYLRVANIDEYIKYAERDLAELKEARSRIVKEL